MAEPWPRYLIDTSAWLVVLQPTVPPQAIKEVECALTLGSAVTARPIMMEVLAQIEDESEREDLKCCLESLPVARVTAEVWSRATALAWEMRRKGMQGASMQILVAAIAQSYGFRLVHASPNLDYICRTAHLTARRVPALRPKTRLGGRI